MTRRSPRRLPTRPPRVFPPKAPPPPPVGPGSRLVPVFVATRNPGKVAELTQLLEGHDFFPYGPEVILELPRPTEDGHTFLANARKKAIQYSRHVDTLVLAEDSGLEVDALDGKPGVRSAQLGGPSASDQDRVRLILSQMEGVPWEKRTARFRCVVALARAGEVLATFDGVVEGMITFEPEGSGGFGYDPIFFYPPAGMTFGAMTPEEKNSVSHRGQAFAGTVSWLLGRKVEKNDPDLNAP